VAISVDAGDTDGAFECRNRGNDAPVTSRGLTGAGSTSGLPRGSSVGDK